MGFWVFSLDLKKPVEFLILITYSNILLSCLFREQMLLGLGRAPVVGCLCAQQAAVGAPSNPPQKYLLAFPSPLAEVADGGSCRNREGQPARPVPEPGLVWSDEDLKSSSPAPALELIAGSQLWQQGPESCWSAACNPQAISPTLPALFIQQPPDCQLRITALLSPPGRLCKLDAPAAVQPPGSQPAQQQHFLPGEREQANEKQRVSCTFEPSTFTPEYKTRLKDATLNILGWAGI